MVALGSKERYIGMTSGETYRRPPSPITASQAIIQLFLHRHTLTVAHDPIGIQFVGRLEAG